MLTLNIKQPWWKKILANAIMMSTAQMNNCDINEQNIQSKIDQWQIKNKIKFINMNLSKTI